jgi:L-threonylcarbamoyladenylate synthase
MIRISATNKEKAIAECRRVITEGGVVAFPTESFYGLGVKYDDLLALKKLNILKRRPKDRALPLIIGDRKVLALIAPSTGFIAEKLMKRFWPGPLTLLVPAKKDLPELITAGSGKVAVRIPGSSFALELAGSLDFPVTATSANISGMTPASHPDEVIRYFGDQIDLLVDGGEAPGGKPSTIVDIEDSKIEIVRKGSIPDEDIYRLVGACQRKQAGNVGTTL